MQHTRVTLRDVPACDWHLCLCVVLEIHGNKHLAGSRGLNDVSMRPGASIGQCDHLPSPD